jgi:microcystin-dependent protein
MSGIISNKITKIIPASIYNIGYVKFIACDIIPDGWMECDGRAISRETFVELFLKIGTTYGTGDGVTTLIFQIS